jgi:hypothetical protein
MNIDAFLDGGFEMLADSLEARPEEATGARRSPKHQKRASAEAQQGNTKLAPKASETNQKKRRRLKSKKDPKAVAQQAEASHRSIVRQEGPVQRPKPNGDKSSASAAVKRELKSHREELEALKLADPSFYEYLQQSDKSLLEFDEESSENDNDEDVDSNLDIEEDEVEDRDDAVAQPSSQQPTKAKAAAQREKQQAAAVKGIEKAPSKGALPLHRKPALACKVHYSVFCVSAPFGSDDDLTCTYEGKDPVTNAYWSCLSLPWGGALLCALVQWKGVLFFTVWKVI